MMWKSVVYTPDKLQEMLEMTEEYYGIDNDISKRKFIEHEYFANIAGNACIKLAHDFEKNILAGQYVVIPVKIKIESSIHSAILSLNTLTRAQYRGQKIFVTLADEVYDECREKGFKFCYGAPNPNSYPGFINRLGFHDIGIMPLYLKLINPSVLTLEKLHSSFLAMLAKPFNLLFHPSKITSSADIVKVCGENVDLFDKFWQVIKDKYSIIGVRDSKYIMWRYINMPFRDYEIAIALENGKPEGYIIGRVTNVAGMNCGMIVDFLVKKGRKDIAASLLSYMEHIFYDKKAGIIGCLMQRHFEEAHCLKKAGFFICPKKLEPQPFPVIYKALNAIGNKETTPDFSNWFFTMGDYDAI